MSSKKPPSSSDENLDESELSRKLKSCVRGVERRLTPSSVVDLGDFQVPVLFADHHVGDSWDTSHVSHMDVMDIPDAKPVETPVHPEIVPPVETVQILPAIEIDPHPTDLVAHFDSGVFTVGETGKVSVDFLYDGGGYKGQLAIFSLKGMESFDPDSTAFIHEAATRALSNSNLGHILIDDLSQAAHFASGDNSGQYLGEQSFAMQSGDRFGMMLVPNGTVQTVFDTPDADGEIRPLFSLATANPDDAYQVGQIADVFGDGKTFVFEDLRFDKGSDGDYNDLVFHLKGATGKAVTFDQLIADGSLSPSHDWRGSDLGHQIESYVNPPVLTPDPIAFPVANQPLIGIIDTGFAANNPDIDYSRITLGTDYIGNDANPLLQTGEGNEHGTHILGIIGATQDNGIGIDGINDDAPIWLGRAVGSGEWANSLTEFVNHSIADGRDNAVVNLSMDLTQVNPDGTISTRYEFTPAERAALEYARQHNVLIVAAAGNDGGVMSVLGQASQEFDNIITVGAADGLGRADYSSYGYGLDILADGGTIADPILSTVGGGVGTMVGTSVATGQVTGAIAQIWAANPDLSYRQVIDIVKGSAIDLNTPGWDTQTGAGLLNLAGAISLATSTKGAVYNPLSFSIPTTWVGAGLVTPKERAAESIYGSFGTAYYLGNLNNGYTSHAVQGYVDGSDPQVYYKFYLSSNSDLNLELTNLRADADVELYDSNQNRIGYGGQSGTSNESIITSLNAGNYFVRVYSFGGNTTGYDLRLTPTSTSPGESLDNTVGYDGGSTHQTYINTFNRNGGSSSLGSPTNNVHRWEGGYIQDFSGGYDARGGIMKSNANDMSYWVGGEFWTRFLAAGDARVLGYPTSDSYQITKSNGDVYKKQDFQNGSIEFFVRSGTGNGGGNDPDPVYPPTNPTSVTINGYTVGGNFYPVFQNYQGTLGNPISGVQYNSNTGASYQLFSSGSIVSSGYGTFPIYGAIRDAYLKTGGLNGFLGAPYTGEVGYGNGVIIQRFTGGYIIWNGVTATAYNEPLMLLETGGAGISTKPTIPKLVKEIIEQPLPASHEFDIKPNFDLTSIKKIKALLNLSQNNATKIYNGTKYSIYDAVNEWESKIRRGPIGDPIERGFSLQINYYASAKLDLADARYDTEQKLAILNINLRTFWRKDMTPETQKKVIMHELAHAFGFGQYSRSEPYTKNVTKDGEKFFFTGENATQAYGSRIELEGNWDDRDKKIGSQSIHFKEDAPDLKLELMSSQTGTGSGKYFSFTEGYNVSNLKYTLPALQDMGFDVVR